MNWIWFVLAQQAQQAQPSELERWAPTVVSLLGIAASAIWLSFKAGARFNRLESKSDQHGRELVDLKSTVKEGFEHSNGARKELWREVNAVKEGQAVQGAKYDHLSREVDEARARGRASNLKPSEVPGGL